MKLFTLISALLLPAAILVAQDTQAPAAPAKSRYVSTIGEVVSIDAAAKQVKVKPDKGDEVIVPLQDSTSFLRMPPGEKELSKATRIELKDISVGDRVLARTKPSEGTTLNPAASIIVMTKADLAQFHEKSRAEWEKRGTVGTVASVDASTKTITITVPSGLTPKDVKTVTVDPADNLVFRRYAPGSAKFQDAKAGTFAEIKVGDRARVLGDKNEDGSHIKAEEIVTGTFRSLAATIISIDAAANSIKVNDLATKKPITVKINSDSSIKRLPQMMAMMLARLQTGGAAGGPGGPGGGAGGPGGGAGGPGGAGGGAPRRPAGAEGQAGGPPAGGPGGDGAGMRGGMRGGAANLPKMIEGLPLITLADLKVGDALVISSVAGNDASEVTAITAIAGVEPILTAPSKGGTQSSVGGSWNFGDIGLPQ